MADPALRLPTNAPGPVFVDRTCIDCAACRRLAPSVFDDAGGRSYVRRQPYTDEEIVQTLQAVVACPVGAIGDQRRRSLTNAAASFPLRIDGPVSELGFHARSSYGATSYLLEHPDGNWMVDAPRWNPGLAAAIGQLGGVSTIFLTHRDDVADAARYARHFGAERIIHARDRSAMPDAEIVIEGDETIAFGPCTIVPTPGHTRGHCVLHHGEYLFTGDHLAWDRERGVLRAYRDVCWYDWPTQLRSVARLRDLSFCWVLPGHGDRVRLDPADMCMMLDDIAGVAISGKTAPSKSGAGVSSP
jgi:glyoxylase-like metal-dependent hydrolase (beta-lactamase superfamily II)/ferredoxin